MFASAVVTILTVSSLTAGVKECRDTVRGFEYRGTLISKTRKGKSCQAWTAKTPHVPSYQPADIATAYNYCRNMPSGSDTGTAPWCYTTSLDMRWDYCDVPFCDGMPLLKQCRDIVHDVEYTGTLSITKTGLICKAWSLNFPVVPGDWPNSSNYCRCSIRENEPWCYITEKKDWEYCDVPFCSGPVRHLVSARSKSDNKIDVIFTKQASAVSTCSNSATVKVASVVECADACVRKSPTLCTGFIYKRVEECFLELC
ncbi:plasminogen-like [Lineus longissimus]|uniref:plasminogen-like n=1 Tax=Lineus longissimus TaxID=88925 RepID=UPI002B4CFAB1